MAQKYTRLSNGTSGGRTTCSYRSLKHLSDGTAVWVDYDPAATALALCYSSDHATVNVIATVTGTFAQGNGSVDLVVDSADNLFVVGTSSGQAVTVHTFAKSTGHTWLDMASLSGTVIALAAVGDLSATWCNTGGGTNAKGHILIAAADNNGNGCYAIVDAGVCLAGTGTLVTASGTNPAFCSGNHQFSSLNLDISTDGFGGTNGLCVIQGGATAANVGSWAVGSSGTLTTNTQLSSSVTASFSSGTKARVLRYASNAWAVVVPGSSGQIGLARFSSTAQLTAVTACGTPTAASNGTVVGAGSNSDWDAFVDPLNVNRIWVIAPGTTSGQIVRLGCSVGSGVAWDTTVSNDDTLTGVSANNTSFTFRAVKEPRGPLVDWQWVIQTASTPTYALLGDYTSFQAPFYVMVI